MNDTIDEPTEVIRHQMEETKSQLSEKLVSLEQQVSETVQSTGTAVNATVEAVQETVEAVTGAVQEAVHSVSDTFDIRLQIERHPFLVVGGAVLVGYLAGGLLKGPVRRPVPPTPPSTPSRHGAGESNGQSATLSDATAATVAAAYEAGRNSASAYQLKQGTIGTFLGMVQSLASSAIPLVMELLNGEKAVERAEVPTTNRAEARARTTEERGK